MSPPIAQPGTISLEEFYAIFRSVIDRNNSGWSMFRSVLGLCADTMDFYSQPITLLPQSFTYTLDGIQRMDPIYFANADHERELMATSWAVTFVRAYELGLLQRAATDWVGGWNAFLDEPVDGAGISAALLDLGLDELNPSRVFDFRPPTNEPPDDSADDVGDDWLFADAANHRFADDAAVALDVDSSVSLSDLTFARLNGGTDLSIAYSGGSQYVSVVGQSGVNRAVERSSQCDGLIADSTRLVLMDAGASQNDDRFDCDVSV